MEVVESPIERVVASMKIRVEAYIEAAEVVEAFIGVGGIFHGNSGRSFFSMEVRSGTFHRGIVEASIDSRLYAHAYDYGHTRQCVHPPPLSSLPDR